MSILKTEGTRAGGYIADEVSPNLSRKQIVIASGAGVLLPGALLGEGSTSGKYKAFDPSADDGSDVAVGVLYDHVDATAADVDAVMSAALTAVNAAEIVWPAGTTDAQKLAAIEALEERQITVLPADGATVPSL